MLRGFRDRAVFRAPCPIAVGTLAALLAVALAAPPPRAQDGEGAPTEPTEPAKPDDAPRDIGLKELAATQLVQLDVSVTGPPELLEALTTDDFEVRVNGRYLEDFVVDRVCRDLGAPPEASMPPSDSAAADRSAVAAPPITYVFFFDQTHLTMEGYHRSQQIAGQLIDGLLGSGARAMIVSSARDLRVFAGLTSDVDTLRAALKAMGKDRSTFDTFANEEERRILDVLRGRSGEARLAMAKVVQQEELWAASRSLQRISMTLGNIAELDPPKAFFYFADTMRRNAGEHLTALFGLSAAQDIRFAALETFGFMNEDSFDRVINEASALGVRFYTIEAQGITGIGLNDIVASRRRRLTDSQSTLKTMALETGGRAFLNGVPERRMVDGIREDLGCMFLVSFSPQGFPLDRPLPVRVTVRSPEARVQTRGRLVIQSETANRRTRLMAAFATGHNESDDVVVQTRVVPTGWIKGRYTTLVQILVPGSLLPNTTWDLGLSLVARGKVRDDASGRLQSVSPGVPLVFEHVFEFPPGPYELVAVAHETTTDQVFSARVAGEMPDPDDAPVTLLQPVVMQPWRAAFLRDATLRDESALAFGPEAPVRDDRPIAVLGLVCRASSNRKTLTVRRSLVGADVVDFEPLAIDPDRDRCALFRDVIPTGSVGPGGFRHEVRITVGDDTLTAGGADFQVVATDSR